MANQAVYFLSLLAWVQVAQSYSTINLPLVQEQAGCSSDCRIEFHSLVAGNERLYINDSSNYEYFSKDCVCGVWTISSSSTVHITVATLTDSSLWYFAACQQTPIIYIFGDTWSDEPDLLASGCNYDNGDTYATSMSAAVVLKYSPGTNYPKFSVSYSISPSELATTTTRATTTTSTVAYSPTTYLFLSDLDLYGVNYIRSSNYPQSVYGQRFATWKLIADSVATPVTIVLSLEAFEVAPTLFSDEICRSNITVYDGGSASSWRRRQVFCGGSQTALEGTFRAYSGQAFVAVSIPHSTYRFSLRYSLQPRGASTTTTTTKTTTTTMNNYAVTLCGMDQELHVSSNSWTVLQTPDYPQYYSGNMECSHKVSAPSDMVVRVYVGDVQSSDSYDCAYESISLYNLDSFGYPYAYPLAKICSRSQQYGDYYSISNRMNIQVQLPYSTTKKIRLYLMASDRNSYAASTLPTPAASMDDTVSYYGNGSLGVVIGGGVAGALMLMAPIVIALHVCRLRRRRHAALRARLGLPYRPYRPLGRTPSSCSTEHLLPPPYSSVVADGGDPPLYTVSEAGPGYLLAMPPPLGGNRLRRREEEGEGEVGAGGAGPGPAYAPFGEAPPSYEELHSDPAACAPLTPAPTELPTPYAAADSPACVQQCAQCSVPVYDPLYAADATTDNSTADVGPEAVHHFLTASDSEVIVSTALEASEQQKSETQQQEPQQP